MTSPGQQALSQVRIHSGGAQVQYASTELAYRVQNLEMTPEGTLRAVRGACRYEPNRGGDQYGGAALPPGYELFSRAFSQEDAPVVYGVLHAGLLGGKAPTLVVRAGTKLYMHAGWARSWKVIYGDKDGETLTDEGRMGTPDCFAVVNNTIIWTNGIDPALVITYDGMVTPLGFSTRPGAVEVDLKAGDAILFVDATCHGSAKRVNAGERAISVFRYGASWGNSRWGYRASGELKQRLSPLAAKIVEPQTYRRPDGMAAWY